MFGRFAKLFLLLSSTLILVISATTNASAGAFGLREQSTYGQGSSFAGVAACGSLSSMFWNPATMTQAPGKQFELSLSGIFPYASNTPASGSTLTALGFGGTGNVIDTVLLPAGYVSWQIN